MGPQGDQIVVKKATHILVSAIHGPFYLSGVHLWCIFLVVVLILFDPIDLVVVVGVVVMVDFEVL